MKSILLAVLSLFAAATIFAQDTIEGSLSDGDNTREGGYLYDEHNVSVNSPTVIKVGLSSEDFDSYLFVKTPDGMEYSNDDHENSDSYLEVFAEKPGTYTIWASTYNEGSTGNYELTIDKSTKIKVDRSEGRLDPRDSQLPKGEYIDTIKRRINIDGDFSIRLACYGFDGFLVVTSPSGEVWRNDDEGDDYSVSMISDLAAEEGEWTIQITTVEVEAVGAYDLEIITFE